MSKKKPTYEELEKRVRELEKAEDVRKRKEEVQSNEKEFTEIALNSQLDTFFLFEPATGKAIRWNQAFNDITGYTDEEIAGMVAPDSYYSPEDLERVGIFIQDVLETGIGTIELDLIGKDGRKVPTEYRVSVIKNEEGKPKYFISIGRDITERKLTERAFKKERDFISLLIELSPAFYIALDPNGTILMVNEAILKTLGYSKEEMEGKNFMIFVPEREHDKLQQRFEKLLDENVSAASENYLRAKNGSEILTEWNNQFVFNDSGELDFVFGLGYDITEQRKSEIALQESEKKYRTIFESSHDYIFSKDRDGRYTVLNHNTAVGLGGTCIEEIIGKTDFDLLPKEQAAALQEIDKQIMATGKDIEIEECVGIGENMIYTFSHKSPLYDIEGKIIGITCFAMDITERKRAEEERRKVSDQLQASIDHMPMGYILWDRDFRVLDWNPEAEKIFGFSRSEVLGRYGPDLIVPEAARGPVGEAIKSLQQGVPAHYSGEHNNIRKDGSLISCRWHNTPLKDTNGHVTAILSMAEEVTLQLRVERALRESEELYRDFIEGTDDLVTRVDSKGRFTYVNRRAKKIFGIDPTECIGLSAFEFVHPDDRKETQEAFNGWVRDRIPSTTYENRQVSRTGDIRDMLWTINLHFDESGDLEGVGSIARDITERKKAEESRRRLETAIEQAAEVVVITDTDGTIQYVNPAFERLTGYTKDEAVGQTSRVLKSGRQDEAFYRDMWNTLTRGDVWTGHFINRAKDGSLFEEEATISPVHDAGGNITNYVAVKRDVTREAELEAQLRQAQKMEAVGTLASGIAHDFNNLLQAMLGYLDLARSEVSKDSAAFEFLEEVASAGNRATDLVRQILAFSRQSAQERRPMRLQPIVTEALKLLRASLPSTIELRQAIDSSCGTVTADPTEIHQVLMNLCTNAYHAMREEGGVLEVTLEEVNMDAEHAALIPNLEPGRHARLTVRDTGHGMDKLTIERVFDPYFTTKKASEGTGLGLATVLGIVKTSRGAVTVDSELGEGTVFEVFLPLIQRVASGEQAEVTEDVTPAGNERVLFVDDEPAVAEIGRLGLQRLGYRVEMRISSLEALEAFRLAPKNFDAVVTDLTMPHMAGIELAREILQIRPDIPIILCTGFSELVDEEIARAAGIRAYVHKPVLPQALGKAVRQVLDSEELKHDCGLQQP